MSAGRLDRRLQFQARQEVSDGAGSFVGSWKPQFEQAASVRPLRGGESVLAARLEARGPAIVTIRNSMQARQVGNDWQAVDTRTGAVYQIKELPRHPVDKEGREQRGWLEMLVERGVAA